MTIRTAFLFLFALTLVVGCGVSRSDYNALKSENEKLKVELDEYQNGEKRLIALVEKTYSEKDYTQAKHNIGLLSTKHPTSLKNAEFKTLLKTIERLELEQKKQKEAEEKEKIRLANQNNTGIWEIDYYIDEFGDKTKVGYINNRELIKGSFSNSATQDSPLDVKFLISNPKDISIKLFEYAGNNPVKAISSENYLVKIKDSEGTKYMLTAVNVSDRLSFNELDSRKIHTVLMKGGRIQFWIEDTNNSTCQYKFIIDKADWYGNAYHKLIVK